MLGATRIENRFPESLSSNLQKTSGNFWERCWWVVATSRQRGADHIEFPQERDGLGVSRLRISALECRGLTRIAGMARAHSQRKGPLFFARRSHAGLRAFGRVDFTVEYRDWRPRRAIARACEGDPANQFLE